MAALGASPWQTPKLPLVALGISPWPAPKFPPAPPQDFPTSTCVKSPRGPPWKSLRIQAAYFMYNSLSCSKNRAPDQQNCMSRGETRKNTPFWSRRPPPKESSCGIPENFEIFSGPMLFRTHLFLLIFARLHGISKETGVKSPRAPPRIFRQVLVWEVLGYPLGFSEGILGNSAEISEDFQGNVVPDLSFPKDFRKITWDFQGNWCEKS